MVYRVEGLDPAPWRPFFGLSDAELGERRARRVVADLRPGFPCRATLEDAQPGELLILVNRLSHDVETPFRSAYAIYIRELASAAACYVDAVPPVFETRTLSLRGFDDDGMLRAAVLAAPGDADAAIRDFFRERREVATIHAHNAAAGCFSARIVRD
ncbi:MAG TPA: DUF1203 domain-containing protein [Allosphingosinicella sp.]|nr:DUF1203 domain-containing protein [Allosphingosinicella sp.]